MQPRRRVAVIEDHPLVRDALVGRLRAMGPVDVVYAGGSVAEAVRSAGGDPVDCAVLDLDLGDDVAPAESTRALVDAGFAVLVVSALASATTVRAVLRAGALGFVSKQAEASEVEQAVLATFAGEPFTSREVAEVLGSDPGVDLSERERTAMVLYASGMKLDAVARRMGVSPSTVNEYIRRVRSKYSRAGTPLGTRTDLYRQARDEGLVP